MASLILIDRVAVRSIVGKIEADTPAGLCERQVFAAAPCPPAGGGGIKHSPQKDATPRANEKRSHDELRPQAELQPAAAGLWEGGGSAVIGRSRSSAASLSVRRRPRR